ncbi:MAG TPA: D-arabinono-1,4-lactone oxidase, partial [Solirubrobacterales bacterium]|nr:D-arabinono-1,4-lactone oxidase [Solirubrobacterales bacterium]
MGRRARSGREWRNWAGDQACRPAAITAPANREDLVRAITAAAAAGRRVSVAGSGHSFTEAALTDGTLIHLGALSGVLEADAASGLVKIAGGTVLGVLSEELARLGLALENLGDIDAQTIAGAISTGTHGTGARLRNVSAQVEAIELVTGDGEVRELTAAGEPELLRAARVGIGALGAIVSVTVRCVSAFTLHRVDSPQARERVLDEFDQRAAANDHFELFTFPYSDLALVLERNRTDEPPRPRSRAAAFLNDVVLENWALEALSFGGRAVPAAIPALSRLAARVASGSATTDRSDRIFVNERRVRFTEMEYALPREHLAEAARRVVEWVRANRYPVFFP